MKKVALFFCGLLATLVCCQKEDVIRSFDEQLQEDLALIDAYLANQEIFAETDSTGQLRYVIDKQTDGRKPVLVDSIKVSYTTSIIQTPSLLVAQDTVVQPVSFLLSSLIEGWRKILPLVGEGGKVTIFVPSGLAYGPYQQGKIPPNSNLVFEVDLAKVIPEFSRQLTKDTKLIDDYIAANNITATKDASSLRYTILNPGAGAIANLTDTVSVISTGRFLSDQTVFDEHLTPKKYLLSKTIRAWQIGLVQLQKGGKIRLYVPSGLAYGAYGTNITQIPVPVAANLIYDLELVDIKKN